MSLGAFGAYFNILTNLKDVSDEAFRAAVLLSAGSSVLLVVDCTSASS
uniref:Uncharacterized protein n=1 Tax=Oryzias melastigma TaxID=30732 RepID=A0A3B3BU60_ORYME